MPRRRYLDSWPCAEAALANPGVYENLVIIVKRVIQSSNKFLCTTLIEEIKNRDVANVRLAEIEDMDVSF